MTSSADPRPVALTVEALLEGMAGATPTFGGGAAVALAGAAAAALLAMVAGVAARHAGETGVLGEVRRDADGLRRRLAGLIEGDVAAYGRVLEARRRTDAQRDAAVRDALVGATEVPLEIAAAGARLLEHGVALLDLARPSTRADLGVAGRLAAAALEGAALTARSNLEALDAGAFVTEARRRLDDLQLRGAALRARLDRT